MNKGDTAPPLISLTGAEHTSAGVGHTLLNIPFTTQQKVFIMSLFEIEVPSTSTSILSRSSHPDFYANKIAGHDEWH